MTIDEFWNTDQRVNRALQAKTTTAQYNSHISAAAIPIRLSNSCSKLSSLVNKTLRYLNSSIWGSKSLPSQSAQSTFFLDLEVLTLILTTSHLVTNHSSKRWRSQPDKAIRTTSSTNSSDATLRTPNWTTPASCCALRSCPWIPQTEFETRDSPGGVQHSLGTSLT